MNVTVYGDSILKGVLLEGGKYILNHSWEQTIARSFGLTVRNRSRFGSTIGKALPLLEKDCREPGRPGEPVLLEFGGNDCDYDWAAISADPTGRHRCKTPPEEFAAGYRQAIALVRESGREPVVLTLPPIHSERYLTFLCRNGLSRENILRWLGEAEAISRWQQTYSDLIRQIAREEQAALADVRSAFPRSPGELEPFLCVDGIHPSRMGQEVIFRTLWRRAEELTGICPEAAIG